jgi:chromosome segregation ATPase
VNDQALTKQDLRELEERLAERFATKQDLADLEQRLSAQFATKQDLTDLEGRLKQDMAGLEGRLRQEMADMEERLRQHTRESIHELETKLLTAFFSWAERMEKVVDRLTSEVRHLHAMDLNLEERMRALENRVFNLEKRLMQHPPAA